MMKVLGSFAFAATASAMVAPAVEVDDMIQSAYVAPPAARTDSIAQFSRIVAFLLPFPPFMQTQMS